jgi:integrase
MAKPIRIKRKDGSVSEKWYSNIQINGKRIRRALSIYYAKSQTMLNEMKEAGKASRHGTTPKNMSWDFFTQEILRKKKLKKNSTYYAYKRAYDLVSEVSHVRLIEHMTPDRLDTIQTRLLEKGYAPVAVARSIRAVITTMRRAEDLKYVPMQNWRLVEWKEPKGRLDFYEVENYKELLSKLSGVWRTSAWLMGQAGLRLGEVLFLEWKDIQFENHRIIFRSKPQYNWSIKDDEDLDMVRTIPMTKGLEGYLRSIARPQGFVLSHGCSRRLDVYGKQLTRALGDTKVRTYENELGHPHLLRHTFGSHLAQGGASDQYIQACMGHKSSRMVKIYSHLRPADVKQGIDCLPEVEMACISFVSPSNLIPPTTTNLKQFNAQLDSPRKPSEMNETVR